MREIKFRGMSHNGWLYGDLIHNRGKVYIAPVGEIYHGAIKEDFEVTDFDSIGHSIGLHDKNGNEIYEGDIVRASINFHGKERKIKYEVKFDDDIDNDSFGEPLTIGYCLLGHNFEVIGNIYDNKDLMMKEEKQ